MRQLTVLGLPALAGPASRPAPDLDRSVRTAPLLVCVDGSERSLTVIPSAKHWHARTQAPVWVVCRVVRRATGRYGTLLEVGCAYRAARAIAGDASWEAVPDGPSAIAEFARYVGASAVMMAADPLGRRGTRGFAEQVALEGPIVIVPPAAPAERPRSPLTLVR